jgi:hypothetical protein
MNKSSGVVWVLLIVVATMLRAQTNPPGKASTSRPHSSGGIVKGTVKDNSGAIIPNASIVLTDQDGATRATESKRDGTYMFRGVHPGTYSVSAEFKGLTQDGVVAVLVKTGQSSEGNIVLKPRSLKEEVTVAETSTSEISVDPSQNAGALILKKEDLATLPDDPDDLAQDLQALAGPSAGPGGAQVYIDGFSSGRLPPKESIREIRINQNPFAAEQDKLGFGRIEIFTKPGSDKFHGTGFYNISDGVWNARNPFLTQTPDFRLQSFGGNLSGPLGKKASFFVDAERRQVDDNGILNAVVVPDATNPFNVVNDRSFVPTPQQRTTFSPRVDWQLGTNNTLSMRYSYLDNNRDLYNVYNFNLPDNGYRYDDAEQRAQITETSILSSKVVNETRFQYDHEVLSQTAVTSSPETNIPGSFIDGGSPVGKTSQTTNGYELQNYTTVSKGQHTIRFGTRIRGGRLNYINPQNFNGTFSFASLGDYQNMLAGLESGQTFEQLMANHYIPQQFTINTGNPSISVNQVDIGAFVQDDWRVAPNFTLSGGLRWEGQTNIHDWRDFAPRLGFAWSPSLSKSTGRPKTVIRGGFGLFYLRFDSSDVLTSEQYNGVNQQSYLVKDPLFYPNYPPLSTLAVAANQQLQLRYLIDQNLRAPYLLQSAIGIERQLFNRTTLSVNFTNTRGVHQYRTRDINAPLPGTVTPENPNSGVRPYGNIGDIYLFESSALLKQTQLFVRVNSQIGKRVSLFGAYVWNDAHSNADGLDSLPVNQYNTSTEWGRSSLAIEHRAFVGGSVRGPLRLQFSPFVIARSGIPFNITTGSDNNFDGVINDRPGIAAGPGPGIVSTPYGYLDLNPKPGEAILARNAGMGPATVSVNLRMSRTWGFGTTKFQGVVGGARARGYGGGDGPGGGGGGGRMGGGGFGGGGFGGGFGDTLSERRYNLTLSINARNLFNHVNYAPPVGILSSPLALQYTSITGGFGAEQTPTNNRRLDLQLRFQF